MKDSKTIISHLKKNPFLTNLKQEDCFSTLLELLPKSFTRHVKFLYIKNNTLFFVLSHPSAKMEFNYKRNLIKGLLKQVINFHKECSCFEDKEIKAFISNKEKEHFEPKISHISYEERSNGKFKNCAKDKKLYDLFEQIREEILCLKKP
jgi:hypothetical protein